MTVNDTNIAELKSAIAANRVIVVLGAGVTAACSNSTAASSWTRLIESGLDYVLEHRSDLPPTFETLVRTQLATPGYSAALIAAAEFVSQELAAPGGAHFREWLRESVGEASLDRPKLIHAIARLGAPIATVNYDTLVEKVTGRVTRTWKSSAEAQAALTGLTKDVVHLHGAWTEPDTVIFGGVSYGRLLGNESAQAIERAIGTVKSLLFIGCGDGLDDPNFDSLLTWLDTTFPASSVRHYRLCRDHERVPDSADNRTSVVRVSYGTNYEDLPDFVAGLASTGESPSLHDAVDRSQADIIERLRTESVFADQLGEGVKTIEQLVVPPVVLPVTHEQYAAAHRDEDGPKIERIKTLDDLDRHKVMILVGEESSGLTTALQWLASEAQLLDRQCAPIVVDFRGLVGAAPVDRSVRKTLRQTSASIDNKTALPPMALAIDNVAPSERGPFPKMLSELPMSSARWLLIGCRPGSEAQVDTALRSAGLEPVTRYLGRLNTGDIKSLAALVAPQQADRLADKAVAIIQREHLARTPLTVCLLVSVLLAGEALLSTASETALLDAYVSLLLGRGSAFDDARYVLDSHDNSSLLGELAKAFVELDSGAVDESVAVATFERYFERVGWTESSAEAVSALVRRHVLVRRRGKIAFSQASLLHLFAAKKAVADEDLKRKLLANPLFYAEIIKHYAALTRNDRGLVERAREMVEQILASSEGIARGANLSLGAAGVISDPGQLDDVLATLERPMFDVQVSSASVTRRSLSEAEQDPLDELDDEVWVPFPLSSVEDMPPLARMIRTLSLASNILRDSEEVQDLELKRQVLARLLSLWGRLVDAFEADVEFIEFLSCTARSMARMNGLDEDETKHLEEFIADLGPVLSAMTGMTLTLSSRKLALMLRQVFDDDDYLTDAGVVIMGSLLSQDIKYKGWANAFRIAQARIPQVRAVDQVLRPVANYAYYYGSHDQSDVDALAEFLADHLSLRAGREGTLEQKAARGRVMQRLKRHRLELTLKRAQVRGELEPGERDL